jgi:hypothetical protein
VKEDSDPATSVYAAPGNALASFDDGPIGVTFPSMIRPGSLTGTPPLMRAGQVPGGGRPEQIRNLVGPRNRQVALHDKHLVALVAVVQMVFDVSP